MKEPRINRKAAYEQVKDAVYQKYIGKDGKPGTRLPSDRALAVEFDVNVATVAKGLTALSMEGVVSRRVGSGTYIQTTRTHTQTVGVYLAAAVTSYAIPEMVFFAKLDQLVQQTLHGRGNEFQHYADSRIREFWATPHSPLARDIQEGKISDLIVIRANPSNYAWLETMDVHTIGFGVNLGGSVVEIDLSAFSSQSVEHLTNIGCKSIGLITKLPPKSSTRSTSGQALHEAFYNSLEQNGLPIQQEWIRTDDFDNTLSDAEPQDSEFFGYTSFQSIWNSNRRPDGIIVHSDIVGLGVIRAARDMNVDLNKDIKAVFSVNHGSAWTPHKAYTRMAFPMTDIVRALLNQVGNTENKISWVKPVLILPD